MRAGKIFINDLLVLGLLDKVCVNRDIRSHDVSMSPKVKTINISLYVSVLLSTKSAKMHSQIRVIGCDRCESIASRRPRVVDIRRLGKGWA
jgi:hypothetical protein